MINTFLTSTYHKSTIVIEDYGAESDHRRQDTKMSKMIAPFGGYKPVPTRSGIGTFRPQDIAPGQFVQTFGSYRNSETATLRSREVHVVS